MAPDGSGAPTIPIHTTLQGTSSGSFWQLHEVGMPGVLPPALPGFPLKTHVFTVYVCLV